MSLYGGGDSDEGCTGSVVPDPWCGPETTCEETPGVHGVACISGPNMPVVGSFGSWEVQEDDMNRHERHAKARRHVHTSSLESKLGVGRASMVMG